MNALRRVLPAILLICASVADTVQASSLLAPENGSFAAYIVVPERASEIERFAAEELAKYIVKITGAEISVVKEKHDLDYFGFYIGHTLKGKKYIPPKISPYEGANGFRIKSVPEGLVIVGGDDISTLFGAYAFLEEYQGCGWFMPSELGEVVPRRNGIIIPLNIDVTQVPDIPIRWIGTDDWALKNRMNTAVRINGHEVGVIMKWNFHTYALLAPPAKYFADHPEYYSFINTHRTVEGGNNRWQLCTSNSEVAKLVTHHLVENIWRNPDIDYISLTPNDGSGYCQCMLCMSQIEPERKDDRLGNRTGVIHTFNNRVAKRFKKFCPDKIIKTGAYHVYSRYPLNPRYKPEDNLAIQICHYDFCFNHPITDPTCPYNVSFLEGLSNWAENAGKLHLYCYASLHGWAQLPWPMVHSIRKDIPEYHRMGAEVFFTQYWYLALSYALNYHVASKLTWNVSLNVDSLITEFCKKFYGAAGTAMEKYHRFLEDSWQDNGIHYSYLVEPTTTALPKFFPPELMTRAELLLHDAESIDADSLSKERIRQIRIDFNYLNLWLNYLEAISQPFQGIDPEQNPTGWATATRQASSIGEVLSNNILKYLDEYYPDSLKRYWGGIPERMLQAHTSPSRIPVARDKMR